MAIVYDPDLSAEWAILEVRVKVSAKTINIKHNVTKDIRMQAAESLEKIDSGDENAVNALVQLLSDPNVDEDTRRTAIESLRKSGSQRAVDALISALNNEG